MNPIKLSSEDGKHVRYLCGECLRYCSPIENENDQRVMDHCCQKWECKDCSTEITWPGVCHTCQLNRNLMKAEIVPGPACIHNGEKYDDPKDLIDDLWMRGVEPDHMPTRAWAVEDVKAYVGHLDDFFEIVIENNELDSDVEAGDIFEGVREFYEAFHKFRDLNQGAMLWRQSENKAVLLPHPVIFGDEIIDFTWPEQTA